MGFIARRDVREARAGIGAFLEKVYNQKRLHSALGYVSFAEFEAQGADGAQKAEVGQPRR